MSGYVAMSRNWHGHDLFEGDEFSRRDAWSWMIAQAAWKPTTTRIKGSKVELQRGDLCFSQRFLAEKWGWSKSRVDRFISLLRDEGMIETRSKIGPTADHAAGQGQSIITICNYDKYQINGKSERGNAEPANGATAGQQRGKEETRNNTSPNGEGDSAEAERQFWINAKAWLKPYCSGDPGAVVGKWLREHRKEKTAAAITAGQLEGAVNPIEYCEGYFRRHSRDGPPGQDKPLHLIIAERNTPKAAGASR